jgi:hypothetical protein
MKLFCYVQNLCHFIFCIQTYTLSGITVHDEQSRGQGFFSHMATQLSHLLKRWPFPPLHCSVPLLVGLSLDTPDDSIALSCTNITHCVFFLQYWGLNSGPTSLTTPPPFFFFFFCIFLIGSHKLLAWGWLWTVILLVSASWVARITGMGQQCRHTLS